MATLVDSPTAKRVRDEERSRVQVVVRVRPLTAAEEADGSPAAVWVSDSSPPEVCLRESSPADSDYLARLRCKERRWAFDAAFGPASSQRQVYLSSAQPLVAHVAAGRGNATVFCYGATGAGKTHTMLGSASQPGVMVQALGELFALVGSEAGSEVQLAYLEVSA